METTQETPQYDESLSILLIGNNPLEMSLIHEQLQTLKEKVSAIYISFNEKEVLKYLKKNKPNCILIDDNYGPNPIKKLMAQLRRIKGQAYSMTLLKTKNGNESVFGFQDYLMKENMNADRLYLSFKNALKFKKRLQKYQ